MAKSGYNPRQPRDKAGRWSGRYMTSTRGWPKPPIRATNAWSSRTGESRGQFNKRMTGIVKGRARRQKKAARKLPGVAGR